MQFTTIIRKTITGIMQSTSGFAEPISRALGLRVRTAAGSTVKLSHDDTTGKIESSGLLSVKGTAGTKIHSIGTALADGDHAVGEISFYFLGATLFVKWRTTTGDVITAPVLYPDQVTLDIDSVEGQILIKNGGVTLAKLANIANMKLLGNVSGSAAAPAEISILDEDNFASNSATAIPTQQSVKAYVDAVPSITVIDEDSFETNSATAVPSQQSTKAYVDALWTAFNQHLASYH
jgi:hypothetical protein